MQLIHLATILASALPLSALPSPAALPDPEPAALLPRAAPITSSFCTGSRTGTSSGAYACVSITYAASLTRASIKLTVDDPRGDSHSSYGWYRVYFSGGKHADSPKLRDSRGYAADKVLEDRVRVWEKEGRGVTGVRVYACVDVQRGGDVCTDKFVRRPGS